MPRNPGRAARRLAATFALVGLLAQLPALALMPTHTFAQTASGFQVGAAALVANAGGHEVMLRDGPGYDANVLAAFPEGTAVEVVDGPITAQDGSVWWGVVASGQSGFIVADFLAPADGAAADGATQTVPAVPAADVAEPVPVAADAASLPAASLAGAVTTSDVNLRAGPSEADPVLLVMPPGAPVEATGSPENGFYPVSYNGQSGWAAGAYLSFQEIPNDGPPAPAPPAVAAPVASSGLAWPFRGGTWRVIQGYNGGTHNNRSGFAQYYYSLDWARVNGETAGQPVYAPASGTIQWIDRGSGGMLIDMGNGSGVAMFHVTYSGGFGRGERVEVGQQLGTISGPGGDGYASTAHVDLTLWQLTSDGGHVSTPFTGAFAIAGQEFPDIGGGNQHLGQEVTV